MNEIAYRGRLPPPFAQKAKAQYCSVAKINAPSETRTRNLRMSSYTFNCSKMYKNGALTYDWYVSVLFYRNGLAHFAKLTIRPWGLKPSDGRTSVIGNFIAYETSYQWFFMSLRSHPPLMTYSSVL